VLLYFSCSVLNRCSVAICTLSVCLELLSSTASTVAITTDVSDNQRFGFSQVASVQCWNSSLLHAMCPYHWCNYRLGTWKQVHEAPTLS